MKEAEPKQIIASNPFFFCRYYQQLMACKNRMQYNLYILFRYWIQGEPNNYGSLGEDCAAFLNIKHPRQSWFDASCSEEKDWLCEGEPQM